MTPTTPRATKGLSDDAALHLLRRATYGPTATSLVELQQQGAGAWLAAQLQPSVLDDRTTVAAVAQLYPRLALPSAALRAVLPDGDWSAMDDLTQAHLLRATQSRRQLFEVMVDFWSNHLNVTCPDPRVWSVRHLYDSQVVRRYALGRFSDLLLASAKHPAMLAYLDGGDSTGAAPNENYGRELLELHTVGVEAGYAEADVRNAALALTGMTVVAGPDTYRYDPTRHFVGPVRVLGWSSANALPLGEPVADSLLRYLANHPATARHVCRKLAARFVTDTPTDALVDRLVAVWTANGTAVVPVLQALLTSPEFLASSGQKVRSPFEDLVATLRTLGYATASPPTTTDGWQGQHLATLEAGAAPLAWAAPNGYPDTGAFWTNPFLQLWRCNTHEASVVGTWTQGLTAPPPTWEGLLPGVGRPTTAGGFVDLLARRLLLQDAPAAVRAAALGVLGLAATDAVPATRFATHVGPVASLLLSAPLAGLR